MDGRKGPSRSQVLSLLPELVNLGNPLPESWAGQLCSEQEFNPFDSNSTTSARTAWGLYTLTLFARHYYLYSHCHPSCKLGRGLTTPWGLDKHLPKSKSQGKGLHATMARVLINMSRCSSKACVGFLHTLGSQDPESRTDKNVFWQR